MYTIKKEIYIFFLILLTAWTNETLVVLDICLGIALYYLLSRIIIIYFSRSAVTENRLQWILNRFNIILLIHGVAFILMGIIINFDFFPGGGDWYEYDYYAKNYSNNIMNPSIQLPANLTDTQGYIILIGLIYYFFSNSVFLAVFINIYFVVLSSILIFILLYNLFDHRVANIGLYFSAFFPLFISYEMGFLKESYILFLFVAGSLATYQAVNEKRMKDIATMLLIYLIILNTRFYLLIGFILYIAFHFIITERYLKKHIIRTLVITGLITIAFINYNPSKFSVYDKVDESFNYLVYNPKYFINQIYKSPSFSLVNILKSYTMVWTGDRIYHIPFLSTKVQVETGRALDMMLTYFSSIILWVFMFVSAWGFKAMLFKDAKRTAILWIPLLIIPPINLIFAGQLRYMTVLYFYVIGCIAYGIIHCRWVRDYIILAMLLIITTILFINKNTVIIPPILTTITIIIGYAFFNWFVKNRQSLFHL